MRLSPQAVELQTAALSTHATNVFIKDNYYIWKVKMAMIKWIQNKIQQNLFGGLINVIGIWSSFFFLCSVFQIQWFCRNANNKKLFMAPLLILLQNYKISDVPMHCLSANFCGDTISIIFLCNLARAEESTSSQGWKVKHLFIVYLSQYVVKHPSVLDNVLVW